MIHAAILAKLSRRLRYKRGYLAYDIIIARCGVRRGTTSENRWAAVVWDISKYLALQDYTDTSGYETYDHLVSSRVRLICKKRNQTAMTESMIRRLWKSILIPKWSDSYLKYVLSPFSIIV